MTPGALATMTASAVASAGMHAAVVTSPGPTSSANASRTSARDAAAAARAASAIEAADALPAEPVVRLARLLWPLRESPGVIAEVLDGRLRPSRDERARVVTLTRAANAALASEVDPPAIRRQVAALGRAHLGEALAVIEAPAEARARVHAACDGAALTAGELAIGGRDLIAEAIVKPGPAMGRLIAELLEQVLDDPGRNTREGLLAEARRVAAAAAG